MIYETRSYRFTGMTPLLGSQPASDTVRTRFIESKAPDPIKGEAEWDLLPTAQELDEKTLTVFLRDPKTNALMLLDYVVCGFLKASLAALAVQVEVAPTTIKGKVDTYIFTGPRFLYVHRPDGSLITDEDDIYERPLRAETMQGPRVALTASERINDPWYIDVTITLLPNKGSEKSKPITWETIEEALNYGVFKGLGQFRNGGYGRFTWERLDNKKEDVA